MVAGRGDTVGTPQAPISVHSCRMYLAGKPRKAVAGYLSLTLGEDAWGAGLTLTWTEPSGGRYCPPRILYRARWDKAVADQEGAIRMAVRGLGAALRHLGYATMDELDA